MSRRGYTLIELLIVFAAAAIVLNVLAAVLVSSNRLTAIGTARLERLDAREQLGTDFTNAVQESRGFDESNGETLVLAMPENEVLMIERRDDYLAQRRLSLESEPPKEIGYRVTHRAIATHSFVYENMDPGSSKWVELHVVFKDDPAETEHVYVATRRVQREATP